MSLVDRHLDAGKVGFKDKHMSGWINKEAGELLDGIPIRAGMKVVDVGCGDGAYVSFASQMGADVTFVDADAAKVRALEASLGNNAPGPFTGIVSNCDPIPLPDSCADLVISTEVLEHIEDPAAFLKEIVRLGNSDATYLITVPDARGENLIKDVANPVYFQAPNHIHIFTAEDFATLAQDAGLEIIKHDYEAGFWSLFYLFKWATAEPGEGLNDNVHDSTVFWTKAWNAILDHPDGEKVQRALNQALPKSQRIVARRVRA